MNSQTNDQVARLRAICEAVDDSSVTESMDFTPIHMSVLGFPSIPLRDILENSKDDINARDKLGRTALLWAASRGETDAVRQLLDHGANPNVSDFRGGQTPLHAAAAGGILDRIQTLLGKSDAWLASFDLHPGPPTGFANIIPESRTAVMELLLHHGANINGQNTIHDNTALHQSILAGMFANAKFLIERGANVEVKNINGDTPLAVCIWESQIDIFNYLLSRGARLDYITVMAENILHTVARTRNIKVMRILSNISIENVDPDWRNKFGQTPSEVFQSFQSNMSTELSHANSAQRDAWVDLLESVRDRRIEEVESSGTSSSGSINYFDC